TYLGSGNDWSTTYSATLNLAAGQNYYLHIRGRDTGGIAGFIGDFTLTGIDHLFPNNGQTISTNTTHWKVSKTGWNNYVNASMVNGNNGVAPWGRRPNISAGATWIWSADAENDNQVYFSLAITSQTSTPPDDGQCSLVYPSVLQSHSTTGRLGVDSGARVINSPSTILPFVTGNINANQGNSCGSADCSVSGQSAEALELPTFPTFSSNNNYNLSNVTLGQGSYSSNTFGYLTVENGTTRFSANHSTYYIKGLTIQNSGKLTLRPGTYWVEQINLNSGNFPGDVQINVEGTGTVYLYVKSGLNTGSNSQINGLTATAALNLSVYQDFNVNAKSTVSGLIYTQGNMHINSDSKVTGAVSAGNLQLNANSTVEYVSGLFTTYDFSQICGSPVPEPTPVLAFYQFDEQSWSGSNSVIDSSDNGHHGNPRGSITPLLPSDQQKSCKVMDVPYNSSFFYTSALDTKLDVDDDIGVAGTVSFWYRSKLSWASSSSRQLLDASNGFLFLFGKSFYLTLYSGKLEFGMEDSADKDAVIKASGLNFAANEWVHVAVTWDLHADKMAIFVNGVAVASNNNVGLNGQMGNLNTLYVGDSRDLYFTGNSSDNSAYGQFDDLRIYQSAQDANAIATDANTLNPCVTNAVDHFRLEHDTQGFTCETESVVLKACKDANCTLLYDQPTSVSLTPGRWGGGNTVNFTGSINTSLNITTAGNYTVSKTASSENASLRCFFGSNETCDIAFVDAGFEFIGATINDKTLPDQLAQTQFNNVQLRSVQDENGVCQAAITGNQDITFGYNCDSPNTCLTPLAGIAISNANGENTGNIRLNFAANGIASLAALNYADVGRLALSAQATIDGAQLLKGMALVDIYPASLQLSVTPASLVYSGPADSDKYTAGKPFEFKIGAYGATGSLLPNYQPGQMQLRVQRIYPIATGAVDGNFRYASAGELGSSTDSDLFINVANLNFSGGQYQYTAAYYDEVGRITIDAQDLNYLGNQISSQAVLTLGHFIPAYYTVEAEPTAPALQNVHSSFSYVGQTISFGTFPALKVTAKNALDQITYNHDSLDWNFRPTLNDVNNALKLSYLDKSGYPGDATVFKGNAPLISGDNNYDGSVVITLPDATIVYNKTDANYTMFGPVSPFVALLDIVLHAAFLSDQSGICFRDNYLDASCNDFTFSDVGGADLRFGRFAFKSTYGPEDEALRPGFAVEYYDQKQWLVNTLDNETLIDFSQAANHLLLVKKGEGNDLTNSITAVTSDGHLLLGVPDDNQDFNLSAPEEVGEVYLRLNPAADPSGWSQYLNYDWSDDGKICNQAGLCATGNGLDYPQATISFGLFRGNDRVIQWREVFN
ncbi:LamG domain-containing protein, partial [Paraglaciecola hydrolytica]